MLPDVEHIVDRRIRPSPIMLIEEKSKPPITNKTPINPTIQPDIFVIVSLSLLKNRGAVSTVKNDEQEVIKAVFVP